MPDTARERFDFTQPPAEYPSADNMMYDGIAIDQLSPPQAIQALLTAGRVITRQSNQDVLLQLAERQNRFNRMWTLIIGLSSFFIGLYVGANYT